MSILLNPRLLRWTAPYGKSFLRPGLRILARRAYPLQTDQHEANIDLIENLVTDIITLAKSPKSFKAVLGAASLWNRHYFSHEGVLSQFPCFVTNTCDDQQIGFRPDRDIEYASILTHITAIAAQISDSPYREHLREGIRIINASHILAREAFEGVPTCMARYTEHNRIALTLVQKYDPPTNCSPSLHVTDMALLSTLLYAWDVGSTHPGLVDTIHNASIDMVACVLDVKQHTLDQVACSLETIDRVCSRFGLPQGLLRRDLEDSSFAARYPHIPVGKILETHDKIQYHARHTQGGLAEVILAHYEDANFPLTPHGHFNVYAEKGCAVGYDPAPLRKI